MRVETIFLFFSTTSVKCTKCSYKTIIIIQSISFCTYFLFSSSSRLEFLSLDYTSLRRERYSIHGKVVQTRQKFVEILLSRVETETLTGGGLVARSLPA